VTVLLAELRRQEVAELALAGGVVVVPIGATEQHGAHLPVSTDTLHVEAIAGRAAEALADRVPTVVAPVLPYGCSAHHLAFGATMSLSSATLLAVLADLGASLVTSGFRRVFLLNGHGGNHHVAVQAAQDLALAHDVDAAAASWWHLAASDLIAAGALVHGNVPGHAGAFETGLVLALRPELVVDPPHRPAATGRYSFDEPLKLALRDSWAAIDGWSDSPAAGRAADGATHLEIAVTAVAAAIERFADACNEEPAR
jgi:creatinine amidohydrolase